MLASGRTKVTMKTRDEIKSGDWWTFTQAETICIVKDMIDDLPVELLVELLARVGARRAAVVDGQDGEQQIMFELP